MAVENRRIVVVGAPRADKAVEAVVVDRRLARELAEKLAKDAAGTDKELRALLLRGLPARR